MGNLKLRWRRWKHRRWGSQGKRTKKVGTLRRRYALMTGAWAIGGALTFMYANVQNIVLDYAKVQTANIATLSINEGVANSPLQTQDPTELIIFAEHSQGHPIINTALLNRLQVEITREVMANLQLLEQGDLTHLGSDTAFADGVIFEVPWTQALNLALFHGIGPKIPVRSQVIGQAVTDIQTTTTPFGINNAMIEIDLTVKTELHVILPFRSDDIQVTVNVPLAAIMMEGEVPNFFWPGMAPGGS